MILKGKAVPLMETGEFIDQKKLTQIFIFIFISFSFFFLFCKNISDFKICKNGNFLWLNVKRKIFLTFTYSANLLLYAWSREHWLEGKWFSTYNLLVLKN